MLKPIVSESLLVFVRRACICGLDYIQPCAYLYVFVGSSCVFVVLITFMRVYLRAAVKSESVSGGESVATVLTAGGEDLSCAEHVHCCVGELW